jgi:protein-export membrane protein SecD
MLYFSRWKISLIVLALVTAVFLALPNFFTKEQLSQWPDFLPTNQIVLGLDLQGGAHLLLQVERSDIVDERLEALRDDVRQDLREDRIGYTGLQINSEDKSVRVRIRNPEEISAAREKLSELARPIANSALTNSIQEIELDQIAGNIITLTLTDEGLNQRITSAVSQSIEVVRRRVDQLGTTEPTIQREGQDRILVQVPGLNDPQRLKDLLQQTARLTFHQVCDDVPVEQALSGRVPVGCRVLYTTDDPPSPIVVRTRAMITGDELADAQPGFEQQTNEPIVTFRFNTSGARKFASVTERNVGKPFAIVLDDEVISAPQIREPIRGGTGQISGGFTPQTANDLAILLRAGALPADLTIIEERTVGPGLGADSIQAGQIAGVIGFIAVLICMALVYGFFGVIADLALLANIILLIALLSLLQATLTLPGIAGIVLTIGMAVDANVLIYERIREEARRGRDALHAIDTGFREAFRTILDANVTTFIAAAILFQLGSGPVRGFAVTLSIGILTTVFTAFTFTRLLIALWVKRKRPKTLPL